MHAILLVLSLITLVPTEARADDVYVPVPRNELSAPAVDLYYGGTRIGVDQAAQLRLNGVDLSLLDPEMNDLWRDRPLPLRADDSEFPADRSTFEFVATKEAPDFYRATVLGPDGKPYELIADMNNHRALATAALMRKLGYQVDAPKFFREITLRFPNLTTYKDFIGYEKTPGSNDFPYAGDLYTATGFVPEERWIKSKNLEKLEIVLIDVNLEKARVNTSRFYQGIAGPEWIQGRRAARAAIVPMALLNFNLAKDSINLFSWELGNIDVLDRMILKHPYASSFQGISIDDVRWIARRIAKLTRTDWQEILGATQFPDEIVAILVEKIVARRNQLMELSQLHHKLPSDQRELPFNPKLSVGQVKKGEVRQKKYPGYVAHFTVGDPASPLRWSEIKHYLKLEVVAQALSALTSRANEELQFKNAQEGLTEQSKSTFMNVINTIIQRKLQGIEEPYVMPIKAWAKPMYGLNVNASRSVVTGTYYGSDSAIQLVDNISIGASVGAVGGVDGAWWAFNKKVFDGEIGPTGFKPKHPGAIMNPLVGIGSVAFMRNYTHVRPLPLVSTSIKDPPKPLHAAWKENWTRILVPLFMRSLGKTLDLKILEKGDPAVKAALKEFLSDIREGEVFTITDTYALRAGPNYTIPLTALMGPGLTALSPSVGISVMGDFAILKRTMITRRNGNIEVYDTKMNTRGLTAGMDLNVWMNVAKVSHQRKKGKASTDAMLIDLEPVSMDDGQVEDEETGSNDNSKNNDAIDPEQVARNRVNLFKTLNQIFRHNEIDQIKKFTPVHHLEHEMKSRLNSGKLLMWSWNSFQSAHKVVVTPPADPSRSFDPKDHARTLYQVRKVQLKGKTPYGFFGQVVGRASKIGGLFTDGGNLNPAGSFLGKSNWTAVNTEAEITAGEDFAPIVTIEDHHEGWFMKKEKLLSILTAMESEVKALNQDTRIFRREFFNDMKQLQAYEIGSNVTIFPEGVKRLEDHLFGARSKRDLLVRLMDISETEDLRTRCQTYLSQKNLESELEQLMELTEDSALWNRCVEPWMRRVMKWVKKAPAQGQREEYLQWMNRTVEFLQKKASLPRILKRIGKDQFVFTLRVSGFRTQDENGDGNGVNNYVADSIGTYAVDSKPSPFRNLKVYSNGTEWTLMDFETNARYFGSGL